ncbi:MAG TPA: hypothetical protein VGR06_13025 [Actinophytocola sp.]|uniref:hypothetical protein n=1 Tax=Actinophytocola sp. TaxID=1872138 RepID=UPI002DFDF304|nr:hypothetical protein [Actinophytocola sp.]
MLAYDHNAHRLYMAAECGTVTVLDLRDHRLTVMGLTIWPAARTINTAKTGGADRFPAASRDEDR